MPSGHLLLGTLGDILKPTRVGLTYLEGSKDRGYRLPFLHFFKYIFCCLEVFFFFFFFFKVIKVDFF